MRIWNPFAFGPVGKNVPPQAPPALRIEGGEATAEQLAMTQQAFAKFCMGARLAQYTNQVVAGELPDGTRYRIARVGPQTIMQIWPMGSEEDWMGGIGISLVNLDGSLLDGHTRTNDEGTLVPQPYILTPEVRKGTRLSTGKWKVRKVPGYSGGKAVNTSGNYKLFYTGIEGKSDINVPLFRGRTTVNGTAYATELPGVNAPVYRLDAQVGVSRDNPIPFVYKDGSITRHMHLVARFEEDPGPEFGYHYDLYVGGAPGKNEPVGDLVDSYNVPDGQFIDPFSITLNEAGTGARASGSTGPYSFFDFTFSPDSLGVTLVQTLPANRIVGSAWNRSIRNAETGTPGEAGYTFEQWDIAGVGDGTAEPESRTPVDGPLGSQPSELGDYTIFEYAPDSYIYDRRGRPDEGSTVRRRTIASAAGRSYLKQVVLQLVPTGVIQQTNTNESHSTQTITGAFGTITIIDDADQRSVVATTGQPAVVSGGGHSYRDTGGKGFIFEDGELGIALFYDEVNRRSVEWSWVPSVDPDDVYEQQITRDETELGNTFKVVCRGQTLLSRPIEPGSGVAHTFFMAGDARSGALLINVQEVVGDDKTPMKSWIFLFDDTGGRLLETIMDIPPAADVRATSNAVILTV